MVGMSREPAPDDAVREKATLPLVHSSRCYLAPHPDSSIGAAGLSGARAPPSGGGPGDVRRLRGFDHEKYDDSC